MLSPEQIEQYQVFGFVILRQYLSSEEVAKLREESDTLSDAANGMIQWDEQHPRDQNAMGELSPFTNSLFESDRFAGVAEQLFGEIVPGTCLAHRYVGDTVWHYDSGGPDMQGVKFGIYLDPTTDSTGALRVIPGTNSLNYHSQVASVDPLGPQFSRATATLENRQRAIDGIGSVPSYICVSDPGDVVAFDLLTYHASLGGKVDRRMTSMTYYQYPVTPGAKEMMILNSRGHLAEGDNSESPWNPKRSFPDDWFETAKHHERRLDWIRKLNELSAMPEGQGGVKAIAEDGKWKIVPTLQSGNPS
jgi:hypothetical protein|tara:strand:- start:336 stop:1247 length:912 start_codon:yes stop_codon:yes gene_type:complete